MECYRFSLKALEPDHLWLFGPLNDVDLELKKESVEALSECIQSTRRCPAQLVRVVGEELIPLVRDQKPMWHRSLCRLPLYALTKVTDREQPENTFATQ